ncbi:hypothetical protein CBS63078_10689 [Aspergillus niger]|uniref:uncharacterized protein n=1 Tax=Aspergillus lacticoffeatus (strain CBS 101883) TaxID=1450533 RepID=UPI0001F2648A|nr:hypothetical protein ANI_1_2106144 [Aspergillus niger CBS 513.88]XP_025448915.1 uncharacterized protein BO96DRAFT_416757 [Aspergillus niger CBS 101883]KAI2817132.1 hypothetical protein CBS133816_10549 [Aspergillus niger]KAI2825178.1 hypothetical protein CBS115989_137 [Aspergillus niger]KAI2834642.1 hypothetical protein CBS11350_10555 [Aspergillus niger]KAI2837691.1 hypothetical protein CBS11232_9825 [Aspergillus niger]KAI2841487.1 hypothetical protein CBS12448_10430 [Aspergillus niger]|eukprot:XP_001398231.2 hypothetical protein ANI_1_2106144 [Aspergillus niger CBS 513.88]
MAHAGEEINHGKKRPADSYPEGDQPLAKRFGRLHINTITSEYDINDRRLPASVHPDTMLLDDTKDIIYIHDLDRELEDIEQKDNGLEIFPGVADRMSTIPKLLVANTTSPCNELVLYTEPTSLSIPKEDDNVRKALIATRERARKSRQDFHTQGRDITKSSAASATTSGRGTVEGPIDGCGEPMEIDVDCWGSIPSAL